MSRGLGWVEQTIVAALTPDASDPTPQMTAADLGGLLSFVLGREQSTALIVSVRRALRSLERKGVVQRFEVRGHSGRYLWTLIKTAKREERRRERARRRQEHEAGQGSEGGPQRRPALDGSPHPDRARLAALLGMLGSEHAGERANAARLADKERRRLGLTWAEALGVE